MSFLSSLCKSFSRLRHSKGFGVHSPFAYRFVIDVLRPGNYGLYSYWEIDKQLNGSEIKDYRFINLIKFVLRLSVFLRTKRIVTSLSATRLGDIAANILQLPWNEIKDTTGIHFNKGDLLIISGSDLKSSVVEKAIDSNAAVFAIHPTIEIREILERPIPNGLLLNGKRRIILIPREEMAYVSYDIALDLCVR